MSLAAALTRALARAAARAVPRPPPALPPPSRPRARAVSSCRTASSEAGAGATASTTSGGAAATATPPRPGDAVAAVEAAVGPLSREPMTAPSPPLVIIVSGPSGVGKDAVIQRLRASRPGLAFVVTATSRPPRPGEADGVDYHFVSRAQFEAWDAAGDLLEHALVYGEHKGVPRAAVERARATGRDVVLRLDVQGAATVRALLPDAVSVFLTAESEAALAARLAARGTEAPAALATRVATARAEAGRAAEFDYVIVNEEGGIDRAVEALGAVIDAEKVRAGRVVRKGGG